MVDLQDPPAPDAIIELCGECHILLDAHLLDAWKLMTDSEKQHACEVLGEARARNRLEGGRV